MMKKFYIFLLVSTLSILLAGCDSSEQTSSPMVKTAVSIPMILTVDPSTGNKNEEEVINAFNKEYEGTYYMDVKWILETEEEYRTNLKRLNVTEKLPAVITDLRMLPSFYQMMIQENRLENLAPYLNEDPSWKDLIEPNVLEACTEPDGSIYLAPISTAFFSCSGVFWNQKLFEQAGIHEFPQTWEEFWNCCDTLQKNSITPLALHTEGTAWAPMLFATARLADSPEGTAFMNELYPDSYQNSCGICLAETLEHLFVYTTDDAMYSDFDVAYENFVSQKAAMIPNGYWMMDQIPEDFVDHVRFSAFPGNKLVSSPETFGWAVVSSYSDEVKKGAVEFLKFRTAFNKQQKEKFLRNQTLNYDQMLQDYITAYHSAPQIVPNYQVKWNSILQEVTLGEYLPKLARNQITAEVFTQKADESIKQFEEEER